MTLNLKFLRRAVPENSIKPASVERPQSLSRINAIQFATCGAAVLAFAVSIQALNYSRRSKQNAEAPSSAASAPVIEIQPASSRELFEVAASNLLRFEHKLAHPTEPMTDAYRLVIQEYIDYEKGRKETAEKTLINEGVTSEEIHILLVNAAQELRKYFPGIQIPEESIVSENQHAIPKGEQSASLVNRSLVEVK